MHHSLNIKYLLINFLLLIAVFYLSRSCSPDVAPTPHNPVDSLKTAVKNNFVKRDSMLSKLETVGREKDSLYKILSKVSAERSKYYTLYRKSKTDTVPCHEILQICDTLVIKDSIQIAEQQAVIIVLDSIVAHQDEVIEHDNLIFAQQDNIIKAQDNSIRELQRDVKKQKRLKRIWAAACCLITGAAILK